MEYYGSFYRSTFVRVLVTDDREAYPEVSYGRREKVDGGIHQDAPRKKSGGAAQSSRD
ncbi:hypothetical protein IX299_000583 [Porphyromonas levii]|nr:hypothetical protein [Porphyromonas levii]MBR8806244.1 hypothetical protein [Porphyromonas levii]